MASSALITTLLLSGTSFAMGRLSRVRQESLSAAPTRLTVAPPSLLVSDWVSALTHVVHHLLDTRFGKGKSCYLFKMFCSFPFSIFSIFTISLCHRLLCLETKLFFSRCEWVLFCFFFLSSMVSSGGVLPYFSRMLFLLMAAVGMNTCKCLGQV